MGTVVQALCKLALILGAVGLSVWAILDSIRGQYHGSGFTGRCRYDTSTLLPLVASHVSNSICIQGLSGRCIRLQDLGHTATSPQR